MEVGTPASGDGHPLQPEHPGSSLVKDRRHTVQNYSTWGSLSAAPLLASPKLMSFQYSDVPRPNQLEWFGKAEDDPVPWQRMILWISKTNFTNQPVPKNEILIYMCRSNTHKNQASYKPIDLWNAIDDFLSSYSPDSGRVFIGNLYRSYTMAPLANIHMETIAYFNDNTGIVMRQGNPSLIRLRKALVDKDYERVFYPWHLSGPPTVVEKANLSKLWLKPLQVSGG